MNPLFHSLLDEMSSQPTNSPHTCITTGYDLLDRHLSGWEPGKLIVIGGRPIMGKTSLALNMMLKEATQQIPVAYFSLDSSEREITLKLIASHSHIPFQHLKKTPWDPLVKERMTNCILELSDAPFVVECNPLFTLQQVKERIREHVANRGIKIAYIDHLQLIAHNEQHTSHDPFGEVCIQLKQLALELNIPIVLLSGLNRQPEYREGLEGKIPQLCDLYGSAQIEEIADVILMTYRPFGYQICFDLEGNDMRNQLRLYVQKDKNGPLGSVIELTFHAETFSVKCRN